MKVIATAIAGDYTIGNIRYVRPEQRGVCPGKEDAGEGEVGEKSPVTRRVGGLQFRRLSQGIIFWPI